MNAWFDRILEAAAAAVAETYGERLVSLAVFGSVARGTPRPDSDIDLLLVARDLSELRMQRVAQFAPVEAAVAPLLARARREGVHTDLSPVSKTPAEIAHGSPLLLDMTREVRILHDREGFLRAALDRPAHRQGRRVLLGPQAGPEAGRAGPWALLPVTARRWLHATDSRRERRASSRAKRTRDVYRTSAVMAGGIMLGRARR